MPRTPGSDDPENLFIDTIIALASNIAGSTRLAYGETDDPDILDRLLQMERDALVIQVRARDYRGRLVDLKRLALQQANGDLRHIAGGKRRRR
jgi:hypothetical protein